MILSFKLSDFKIQYLHVVSIVLMMLESLTIVTHSADFSNSPATEDCHPQPTPIPGKWHWPLSLLCVVHALYLLFCDYITTAQSPPSLVKSAPDLASKTGETILLLISFTLLIKVKYNGTNTREHIHKEVPFVL